MVKFGLKRGLIPFLPPNAPQPPPPPPPGSLETLQQLAITMEKAKNYAPPPSSLAKHTIYSACGDILPMSDPPIAEKLN